jgi:hypothetical protein
MFKILLSSSLLLTFCTSKVESVVSSPTYLSTQKLVKQKSDMKILVYADSKTTAFNNFLTKNNIQKVGFVNDVQFLDPKTKFAFNQKLLDQELVRAYPNPQEEGLAYIDLEAPYLDFLMNSDINSSDYKQSKKLFLDVLSYVKKSRPNVKWGFYYVPFTTYWGRTDSFYNKDNRISEIIKNSDVLFPSIYIFYNKVNFILENKSYLEENTAEIIKIGQKYNKKVYPLIMSRYHPSNESLGYETIGETDFRFYLSTIRDTKYNGKTVDGIMLWNADGYSNRIQEPKLKQELQKSRLPFEKFYDQYLINVLSVMIEKKQL